MDTEFTPTDTEPFRLDEDKLADIPPVEGPYEKLCQSKDATIPPFEIVEDLRQGIEAIPDSRSLFSARDVVNEYPVQAIKPFMFEILGSWVAPTRVSGTGNTRNGRHYVNPTSPDAWHYSDAFAMCECGALVTTVDVTRDPRGSFPGRISHADDCKRVWRWRSRCRLWERRRRLIVRLLRLGHDSSNIGYRLGYRTPDCPGAIRSHDVDIADEKKIAKHKIGKTLVENIQISSPPTVAKAFGLSSDGIRKYVDRYTDEEIDFMECRKHRLSTGAEQLPDGRPMIENLQNVTVDDD